MITYYKGNYKYQLALISGKPGVISENYSLWFRHPMNFEGPELSETLYIRIQNEGEGSVLYIRNGYSWNGASGPTLDTPNSMEASLIHDALWQMISEGHLSPRFRAETNAEFKRVLLREGMSRFRTWMWLSSVSTIGKQWVRIFGSKRKLITAPRQKK